MKIAVYTLYAYNYLGQALVGIYSSPNKADQASKRFPYQRTRIEKVIVDN